jgi:hypothetical protein
MINTKQIQSWPWICVAQVMLWALDDFLTPQQKQLTAKKPLLPNMVICLCENVGNHLDSRDNHH